jgi:hypothetical protein
MRTPSPLRVAYRHLRREAEDEGHVRLAFNAENAPELVGKLITVLTKAGLSDEATLIRNHAKRINNAWSKTRGKKRRAGRDAPRAYQGQLQTVNRQLQSIAKRVKAHAQEQKDTPMNWGWVGDMAHVAEMLEDVDRFLRDAD